MDRTSYIDETYRTIPMVEGRTIERILTMGSFAEGMGKEVTGFRIRFTDGTEAEFVARNIGGTAVVDIARSTGLYTPGSVAF